MPKISIIVCTKNRSKKLIRCLRALNESKFTDFEIVVVDQSSNNGASKYIENLKNKKICYVRNFGKGLATARNIGIKKAKATILAFTDDDCIPDNNWLHIIWSSFNKYPKIVGIFGITQPYQSEKHKGFHCPCIFTNKNNKTHFITKPIKHFEAIGYGNNMAFRKDVFYKLGGFKEYLGVGSIGKSAEDAEFALRTLISKKTLLYNPKMLVFHDRWLTDFELKRQELLYIVGENVCYGQFSILGHSFAQKVITDNLYDTFVFGPKEVIKSLVHFDKKILYLIKSWFLKTIARFYGLAIAILYSKFGKYKINDNSKYLIIYSSRFPITTPPAYYYSLAKEFSKKFPTIMLDLYGYCNPVGKINMLIYKFKCILNIFPFNSFWIFSVSTRVLRYSIRAKVRLYKYFGYKVVLIRNFLEPNEFDSTLVVDFDVFDCTDHYYKSEFTANKKRLKSFDMVFVNYDYLGKIISKHTPSVVKVPTGYLRSLKITKQNKLAKSVVFSGGISRRIDFSLLKTCILSLPDYTFYFFGEIYLNKHYLDDRFDDSKLIPIWNSILALPNVKYLGDFDLSTSVEMLTKYEIGIIPYNIKDYMNRFSNPMKTYEYLLAGLPVVSVPLKSILENRTKFPIYIADNGVGFAKKIVEAHSKTFRINKEKLISENYLTNKVINIIEHVSL